MSTDDEQNESFEEQVRAIAEELGRTVERAVSQFDLDGVAGAFGIDPDRAREWAEGAGGWLRAQAENLGEDIASQRGQSEPRPPGEQPQPRADAPRHAPSTEDDPLRSAAPHPLDVPTEEQGRALAALHSGRWTVEPGSHALAGHGDGPSPDDALGLVRELRVRDWISTDGAVTVVGRHALMRWLESAPPG
jgi:hypothetical protein